MVEIRKVQQVGHSTLVVAIPKKWANKVELKQGSQVIIEKETDGSFRIRTKMSENRKVSKCIINADKCNAPDMLVRAITGVYLAGREVIEVSSKKELTAYHLEQTRDSIRRLTGLGIIEQTSNEVVIHDFLDPAKFPFKNLVKHMFQIISFIQETIINALESSDPNLVVEVSNLEYELDHLYWLTVKQLLFVINEGALKGKIGISSRSNAAGNYVVVKCLEEIADHYESIGAIAADVLKEGSKPDDESLVEIIEYSKHLHTISDGVLETLLSSDAFRANGLINEVEGLLKDMDESAKRLLKRDGKVVFVVNVNSMLWNLKEVARQSRSVLETVINHSIAECKDVCSIG